MITNLLFGSSMSIYDWQQMYHMGQKLRHDKVD